MKTKCLSFLIMMLFFDSAWAQYQSRTQPQAAPSWRRNTAVVLFSGIGGGLIGLSTLSFYGDPKEHTQNITTGALLGLIVGAGYLVYDSVPHSKPTRTYDYYGLFPSETNKKPMRLASLPQVQFEFSF